ncbi:hypothetical protein DXV75_15665 [Alteromonas aestuariivivens]|uniref:Uncharacterized protein n=2 Tax=Alteromonas aestuariivivens TaxID=1938339 RepID=A0A3D8M3J0_9ALTE|nr:hypothetical protein DXV75_15665 [Alteromonas aestuariivivens]
MSLSIVILVIISAGVMLSRHYLLTPAGKQPPVINGLGNQCEFVNLVCTFGGSAFSVRAEFHQVPRPEEQLWLDLSWEPNLELERAWVEGVNMFMGRVPLMLEGARPGVASGWFMLGSCSEPAMQWHLVLHFKGQAEPVLMQFTTRQH